MTAEIHKLPVLVINPHGTCNCRCAMCDIWKRTTLEEIGPDLFDRQLADIERLGVEWVVFSGGEPLLHADLFRKAAELRRRNIRVTLLSSGLLLSRHAVQIVTHFDDVIVSLDGPRAVHDRIRGISRAFDLVAGGIRCIHKERPGFPVSGRCTLQRANCSQLMATVAAAREIGLASLSFLAADIHSTAFNRQPIPMIEELNIVAPLRDDVLRLDAQIEELIETGLSGPVEGGYVRESPEKLRRIAQRFRSYFGDETAVAPQCNAPWTSAVVEADGAVRPCFFQPAFGRIGIETGLADILNGPEATGFRAHLNMRTNPICRKCVCSLNWKSPETLLSIDNLSIVPVL
jgi:MoaA/NifB/PqqE/SkfB family radical SAM enzyme